MTNVQDHPLPGRIGQATVVEQSRAVAEVQAMVITARECPRSLALARQEIKEACTEFTVADQAFYNFKRAGEVVSGPTIHLAKILALCWQNVQYGIHEMRRDDEHAQSEMMAWAWDMQANTRSSSTFIVPHKRDKKSGPVVLKDMRDIYENNTNQANRRLREQIFAVLPSFLVREAITLCNQTLDQGEQGKPMPVRRTAAVHMFDGLGVSQARLEQKLGKAADRWTAFDLRQLRITFRSIERGEISIEDEFPQARVTADEIKAAGNRTPTDEPGPEPAAEADSPPEDGQPPTLDQFKAMTKGKTRAIVSAVRAEFPDDAEGLDSLEAILADPRALDYALGVLEQGR